jgi:hypothetical protein
MHETHFVLGHHWPTHFLRKESQDGGPVTVAKLRAWMDEPSPMGLPKHAQNLVIMVFAAQTNRSFYLHNAPIMPTLESLSDELELREQRLPSQAEWEVDIRRGEKIFGLTTSPLVNAGNVAKFVEDARAAAEEAKAPCEDLARKLRELLPRFSNQGAETPRLKTAHAAQQLIEAVLNARGGRLVEAMAGVTLGASEEAVGRSVKKAPALLTTLEGIKWDLLEGVRRLTDYRSERGKAIWTAVKDAFERDEYAVALGPALQEAESSAVRLLTEPPPSPPEPPGPKPKDDGEPEPGYTIILQGRGDGMNEKAMNKAVEEIREAMKSDKAARVKLTWEVFKR